MIIQIGMKCKIEVELRTEFLLIVDGNIVTFLEGSASDSLHSSFVIAGNTQKMNCSSKETRAHTHTLAVAVSPLNL